jgi:drug/metabolite transporter (DMT)-like permease
MPLPARRCPRRRRRPRPRAERLVAILGGFGAALAWALSTLCSSRASRIVDPSSVVAWVALTGLVAIAPFVIASGVPGRLDGSSTVWLVLAGGGNIGGLLVAYLAYRSGAVALIAPLIATEGAIAALIAIAAGEAVGASTVAALGVVVVGVSLAAMPAPGGAGVPAGPGLPDEPGPAGGSGAPHALPDAIHVPGPAGESGAPHALPDAIDLPDASAAHDPRVLALAAIAALGFGISLYATGRVSSTLPLAWVVLPTRLIGALVVALPLLARGRLRLARGAAPLVVTAGLCEVLGFSSYTLGARHDIAVAAVVACQFAALSAIGGYALFGERLSRAQVAGVVVLLAGVTLLSAVRG